MQQRQTRLSFLGLGLLGLAALLLGWAGPAGAITISPNPVEWTSFNGSEGDITFLGSSVSGPNTTLTFQASHDGTSTGPDINAVDIAVLFINPTGSSSGAGITDSVGGGSATFNFDSDLAPGETSSTFSVSYATTDLSEGQTLNIEIDDGNFSNHPATISLLPEPASALLLTLAGLGLGALRRRA